MPVEMTSNFDHLWPDKKDPYSVGELNFRDLVNYLHQFGSPIQVVPLAEVLRTELAIPSLLSFEEVYRQWQEGVDQIRLKLEEDLALFMERAQELNPSFSNFLSELEQEIHRVSYVFLSRLAKLQEKISQRWQASLSSPNLLPVLEGFFRNGELVRLQKNVNLWHSFLINQYRQRLEECQKEEYFWGELNQTCNLLRKVYRYIFYFYEKKWLFLLLPSNPEPLNPEPLNLETLKPLNPEP